MEEVNWSRHIASCHTYSGLLNGDTINHGCNFTGRTNGCLESMAHHDCMTVERNTSNRYDDKNIYMMESVYGRGYLSPGGNDEVSAIIENTVSVEGKTVLDLGCGLGGSSIALAKNHKAKHVTAADIDPSVLSRAVELVSAEELDRRITIKRIDAGPLPFDANNFEIVYMSAVSCHIRDLPPFFKEINRILVPGGHLIGIEWLVGDEPASYEKWDQFLRQQGLNFFFVTETVFRQSLVDAAFCGVSLQDRTASMGRLTDAIYDRVCGKLHNDLKALLGVKAYQDFREWCEVRATALQKNGAMMQQFHAVKAG